jgi:hypothetical protein
MPYPSIGRSKSRLLKLKVEGSKPSVLLMEMSEKLRPLNPATFWKEFEEAALVAKAGCRLELLTGGAGVTSLVVVEDVWAVMFEEVELVARAGCGVELLTGGVGVTSLVVLVDV